MCYRKSWKKIQYPVFIWAIAVTKYDWLTRQYLQAKVVASGSSTITWIETAIFI